MGKRQSSMESVVVMRISLKQRMKNILKRFIPIPTNAFIREVNHIISEQDRKIDQLANLIKQQNDQVKMQLEKVDVMAEQQKFLIDGLDEVKKELLSKQKESSMILRNLQEDLKNKSEVSFDELNKLSKGETQRIINSFRGILSPSVRTINYTSNFERTFLLNTFKMETFDLDNFESRLLKLLHGVDPSSVETVGNILNKMKLVLASDTSKDVNLNILTVEEQNEIYNQVNVFRKNIIKLSDNLFCCQGYYLPINHFAYSVFGDKHGIRHIKNLDEVKRKNIIDVGAFIGDSALVLSPYTDKRVYSFEASPENYNYMLKTIELNGLKNVVPVNCALSSSNRKLILNMGELVSVNSIGDNGFAYTHQVEVNSITLDEYVAENSLEVGLIKVDIEGAEQDFLKGAMKTIVEQRPILLLSIYHSADDFFDIKPMLESLNLGYEFKIYHPMIHSVLTETLLIAQIPK